MATEPWLRNDVSDFGGPIVDQAGEARGKGGAGHADLGGQRGDRPPVGGIVVQEAQRVADPFLVMATSE